MRGRIITSLCGTLALSAAAIAQVAPGFYPVGHAPGTTVGAVNDLSGDGSVAVGGNAGSGPKPIPVPGFIWTPSGGRYDFGLEPGMPARTPAYGVSTDGNIIVGYMQDLGQPARAYRRVGNGPLQNLGPLLTYARSYAADVSGDGSVVVGHGESTLTGGGGIIGQAFRWTESGGMEALGWLGPFGFSQAHAVSRDGTTIVGESNYQAFVWTEQTGMRPLAPLPGGVPDFGGALDVNADGTVIVGDLLSPTAGRQRAVRWVNGIPEDLGVAPGGLTSHAYAVSDDGSVVGASCDRIAAVWTPATGMLALTDYLALFGVSVPTGWNPEYIYAVSGDGLAFAGYGRAPSGEFEGFVAVVPAPAGLLVLLGPALVRRRRRGMR